MFKDNLVLDANLIYLKVVVVEWCSWDSADDEVDAGTTIFSMTL